jgi:hypothetical protein
MSKYSGFILVQRNIFGPYIFVGCHRMSENSGVGLHKFHCTNNSFVKVLFLRCSEHSYIPITVLLRYYFSVVRSTRIY